MQTMHDLKNVALFPVDQGERCARDREFLREGNPAGTAHLWFRTQQRRRMLDAFVHQQRCGRTVFGDDLYAHQ